MKKLVSVVVALVLIGFVVKAEAKKGDASDESVGNTRLGYVDLNRALNEVNEGKSAKAKLEADGKAKKQKLEILQNEIKNLKDELEKKKLILSAQALQDKQQQFQQKFVELQKMTMEFEQDFAAKEASYIKPISDKMQRVISKIGQNEGYAMIVPKEMALYSLPGTDLTDKVISDFNKSK